MWKVCTKFLSKKGLLVRCCLNKAKGFCMCLQLSGMFILLQLAVCLLVSAGCDGVGVLVWLIHVVDGQFLSCARCPLLVWRSWNLFLLSRVGEWRSSIWNQAKDEWKAKISLFTVGSLAILSVDDDFTMVCISKLVI